MGKSWQPSQTMYYAFLCVYEQWKTEICLLVRAKTTAGENRKIVLPTTID